MSIMAANWFGLGKSSQQDAEGTSLLEDWNSYSTASTRDVEAGGASTSGTTTTATSTTVFTQAGTFLSNSFTTVSKGVSSGVSSAQAVLPSGESFSIPSSQQLAHFFMFLAGGVVLLLLAFMLFLPVIILSPSKFALSFTMGCMLIFIGFAQLRGWKQQVTHMFSAERLPFSSAYIGSILATLYAALFMHSYIFCLLCSGLQVVTLLYYLMSYFPGGTQGVKFMLNLFAQAVMSCFGGVQRMLMK